MKINIEDRKTFLGAWDLVAGHAPKKAPLTNIDHIKITADPMSTTLMATDLNVSIRAEPGGVVVHQHGSALLPVAKIGKILDSGTEPLSLESDKDRITIKGERSKFAMETFDADKFPEASEIGEHHYRIEIAHQKPDFHESNEYQDCPFCRMYGANDCPSKMPVAITCNINGNAWT